MATRAELYAVLAGETPTDADFLVNHQGTIGIVSPRNEAAQDWLETNLSGQVSWQGDGVEHRYLANLLEGIQQDGFSVHFY